MNDETTLVFILAILIVVPILVIAWFRSKNNGQPLSPILRQGTIPNIINKLAPTNDRPGKFEIIGVDRSTKMDTRWTVDAESAENAKVKAELEGIIVTSVTQIVG